LSSAERPNLRHFHRHHVHPRLRALWKHHGTAAVPANSARLHGHAKRLGVVARRTDDHDHDAHRRHFAFEDPGALADYLWTGRVRHRLVPDVALRHADQFW